MRATEQATGRIRALRARQRVGGRLRHHVIWAISGLSPTHTVDHSQSLPLALGAPTRKDCLVFYEIASD
eukprot:6144364-Pyramimonas_sp.AAC.1